MVFKEVAPGKQECQGPSIKISHTQFSFSPLFAAFNLFIATRHEGVLPGGTCKGAAKMRRMLKSLKRDHKKYVLYNFYNLIRLRHCCPLHIPGATLRTDIKRL